MEVLTASSWNLARRSPRSFILNSRPPPTILCPRGWVQSVGFDANRVFQPPYYELVMRFDGGRDTGYRPLAVVKVDPSEPNLQAIGSQLLDAFVSSYEQRANQNPQ